MGLPISDDYLYETFEIDRPEDYKQRKKEIAERKEAERQMAQKLTERLNGKDDNAGNEDRQDDEEHSDKAKSKFSNRIRDFFGVAPQDGA